MRQATRGDKTCLTESIIRRLNPKGDLNEKYGGYLSTGKMELSKGSVDKYSTQRRGDATVQSSSAAPSIPPTGAATDSNTKKTSTITDNQEELAGARNRPYTAVVRHMNR